MTIPPHLIDALEAHVAAGAGRAAVHFLPDGVTIGGTLSFGALHEQAQTLAAAWQARYAPGARVLLMLPSGLDYVRAFCACVYAGLIAVPLYEPPSRKPRHQERLRKVVADAAPALIVCPADACEPLAELVGAGIDVAPLSAFAGDAHQWTRPASDGAAVAFLQYTSGSTGSPKGVVVRQRNLIANLELMRHAYGFVPGGAMVNWLPLYHDMGLIGGLLAPLYAGMPCYLMASQTFVKAPSVWMQALSRYSGTASFAPNFAYALCCRTLDDATIATLDLSAWQHAINGAEPIHPGTLAEFAARLKPAGFRAPAASPGYGQAEATLCVSATPADALPVTVRLDKTAFEAGHVRIAAPEADAVELVACGYPQPEHAVAIVNPHTFTRAAPDEIGEIWLSGPSNAEEYWNNPEASRSAFAARIEGEEGNWLRSGDLGFLYQGQVVICSRLKDLIILNGRNLYPHDIEFAITDAVPALRAGRIAAFAQADAELGREQLVIVAEPQRKYLDAASHPSLFAAMRQAARDEADCALDLIVLLEPGTIPMTTSGKISRQGAKQQWLDGTLAVLGSSADSAQARVETLDAASLRVCLAEGGDAVALCRGYLAHLVQALAPRARADFDVAPLALGLDSLALYGLAARLERELGWAPELAELFGERTLGAWAEALAERLLAPEPAGAPEAEAVAPACIEPDTGAVRQSYAQRRLWFLNRLNPDSGEHNLVARIRLAGPLDVAALTARLATLGARHPVLRTIYRDGADGPVQQVDAALAATLAEYDLRAQAPHAQQQALADCAAAERATPFDLERAASLRAQLFRLADDAYELVLTIHHIACDGRSAELLLADLGGAEVAGRGEAPTYAEFARWEAAHWTDAALDAEFAFWSGYLADLPTEHDLGSSVAEAVLSFQLSVPMCERLTVAARARRMTPFMVLLTLYQVVLGYLSGAERFLIGTDVAGRPPHFDATLGFFVNQLALRCDLSGAPTLGELAERVRTDAQAAYAHQALPFDLLVSALAPARVPGRAPLFQAKLNYQPARADGVTLGAARVTGFEVTQALGDFDLVLDLVHGRDGISAQLKHRIDPERACRLQHLWLRLVAEFDTLCAAPLPALMACLADWDHAWQRGRQDAQTDAARSRLNVTRRRTLTV